MSPESVRNRIGSLNSASQYKVYTLRNFEEIPQINRISPAEKHAVRVAGQVIPFRVNNYILDNLIDWNNIPYDPLYRITFPQKEMLLPHHFESVEHALATKDREVLARTVRTIHRELNPHPAGQMTLNIPELDGMPIPGLQHKYRETVLAFPRQGQTCHAYCTFCFRWPQFVRKPEWKIGLSHPGLLRRYLETHREVTDVLFTGGDPGIMRTKLLRRFIEPVLSVPHLQNIRFGTKTLSHWPYRYVSDPDADDLLRLFEKVVKSGRHLAVMAHFTHPVELQTDIVKTAINRIRETGAEIRTQVPLLHHINDAPDLWADMWTEQVRLGCVPYYMFIARDTGAQHYFAIPLVRAWHIFRQAYQRVSGIARTVRGPVMSASPGKIQVLGVKRVHGERVFVLRMIQGRNHDWVLRPFFARFDSQASWLSDLRPPFGKRYFFYHQAYPKIAHGKVRSRYGRWSFSVDIRETSFQ